MGWSSWNAFRVDISEDIIKHQADLMVKKGCLLYTSSEEMTQQPVTESVLVGVNGKSAAISPLDFGVELDEQGVPVSYSQVLTNQVATGYHVGAVSYTHLSVFWKKNSRLFFHARRLKWHLR